MQAGAQTIHEKIVIYCETAGSLVDSLTQKGHTDPSQIKSLVISGHLNAADFRALKQMPLESLDISDIVIDAFYGLGTYEPGLLGFNKAKQYPAHTIPINAFSFRSSANNSLSGMNQLKSILLPATLKVIDSEAFAYAAITEIFFPESLEKMGINAFYSCRELKSMYIPALTSVIGSDGNDDAWYGAFGRCISLEDIQVSEYNDYFKSIKGTLYSKNGEVLRLYPIGKKDTELEIPEGVKRIGHESFEECQSLQSITIPASVEVIERAFWYCDNLSSVICKGETPAAWYAMGVRTLVEPFNAELMNNGTLFVPLKHKEIYERNKFLSWGMFKNIRETEEATAIHMPESPYYQLTTSQRQIRITQPTSCPLRIQISSISGQLLYDRQGIGLYHTFSVSKEGVYIVRINNESYKLYCK